MRQILKLFSRCLCAAAFHLDSYAYAQSVDPHAHHHNMVSAPTRAIASYNLPSIKLVREDGKTVSLVDELNDGRPVILNFIYTTCTTVCPVTSQTFSQLQAALGPDKRQVHLVSISIDPEQDTPARLQQYAKKFGAGSGWNHYTGTVEASLAAQRAFDVYRGDKMNHNPVTFLRAAPGRSWLRIDGFSSSTDLLNDYRNLSVAN